MFNRKLKEKIERLEEELKNQYQRIKQLECSHGRKHYKKQPRLYCAPDAMTRYIEECHDCGKFFDVVDHKQMIKKQYQQAKEQYNKICGGSDE